MGAGFCPHGVSMEPPKYPGDPDPADEFDEFGDEFDIPEAVLVAACEQAESPQKRGAPHEVNDVSQELAKRQKTDTCFRCGMVGHWASNCPNQAASSPSSTAPTARTHPGTQEAPVKPCPCGAGPCSVLTSQTPKNPGRRFYKCPAPKESSCNFFEWLDANEEGCSGTPGAPSPVQNPSPAKAPVLRIQICALDEPCSARELASSVG